MDNHEQSSDIARVQVIPADNVGSLVWSGNMLVDWVSGGVVYSLDGTKTNPLVSYSYRFDAAVESPSGRYAALYERLGTKAILVGPGRLDIREVNRSFYHAEVYEYPIQFVRLAGGREALAHCPDEYCHLRLDDPATGERWSDPATGRVESYFYSRIAVNPAGTRLLTAGWVWHPFETIRVYDLIPAADGWVELAPRSLACDQGTEITSAAFDPADRLIVSASREAEDFHDGEPGERLRPGMLGVFDLDRGCALSLVKPEDEVGTLMPVGTRYVVGFYDHPKLIELATGRVVARWPGLATGHQLGTILWHKPLPPPIALDPAGGRFAVAGEKGITVVVIHPELVTNRPA